MTIENIFHVTAIYAENIFSGTESYVTEVAQAAVYLDNYFYSGGGIDGVYVGTTPPNDPYLNQIWIQI